MSALLSDSMRKYSIRNGLIFGAISLFTSLLSYYLIVDVVKSPIIAWAIPLFFSFFLTLILAVFFCFTLRKQIGGYWDMREATSAIFIMFLISFLMVFIGRDLIYAPFIEPKMNDKLQTAYMNASVQVLTQAKATPQQIADKIKEINDQFAAEKNATTWQRIQSPLISMIFLFVIALIFGALFKKQRPQYLQPDVE